MKLGQSRGMVHPRWVVQKAESGYYRVRGPNGLFPRGRGVSSGVIYLPVPVCIFILFYMYLYYVPQSRLWDSY